MDDTQFRAILAEMKTSNTLMKAMVSELSQIKFELVNERMLRDATYKIKIPRQTPYGSEFIKTLKDICRRK